MKRLLLGMVLLSLLVGSACALTAPWSAREDFPAVITPNGSIIIMGGGFAGLNVNDTWVSVNNGTAWTRVNASSGWVQRSSFPAVVTPNGSIIIMGGYVGTGNGAESYTYKNDTWVSINNGTAWTRVNASSGWNARMSFASVITPNGSIIVMGGSDASTYYNDVWISINNGTTWTQQTASAGWTPRDGFASTITPSGVIVVMGGLGSSGTKNDVWISSNNGTTWTRQTASAGWSSRFGFPATITPTGNITIMGGLSALGAGGVRNSEVWLSPDIGITWTQQTASAGWEERERFPIVYSTKDSSIVLMGGEGIYHPLFALNDTWWSYNNGVTWYPTSKLPIIVGFTGTPLVGALPLTVVFTDTTTGGLGAYTYLWDFGDGTTSILSNPSKTYVTQGIYTVSSTITDNVGTTNSSSRSAYVSAGYIVPVAAFNANTTVIAPGWSVLFTDTSTGPGTAWNWTFGDGTTSPIQQGYPAPSLLLHANGTSQSTVFRDSSLTNSTVTTVGNATINTTTYKFGGASGMFDGINSSLRIPNTSQVTFGQMYTVSAWVYTTDASIPSIVWAKRSMLGAYSSAVLMQGGWYMLIASSPLGINDVANGVLIAQATPNIWQHLLVTKNATHIDAYLNGVRGLQFPIANTSYPSVNNEMFTVGGYNGSGYVYPGYIDELALWNNTAMAASAVYPQPSEFPTTGSTIPMASTQNAIAHTYVSAGMYSVNDTVYNAAGGAYLVKPSYITVLPPGTPVAGFTQSATSGIPGVLISFTDSSWRAGNVTANYTWNFGDSAGTQPISYSNASVIGHVYTYGGVFTPTLTVSNASLNNTFTGQPISVSVSQNAQNTWWTPHTVQLTIMDTYGARLTDLQVSATFNMSSMPTSWIQQMYGIQSTPAGELLNRSLVMGGTTGSDGTITLTMLGSLKYDIILNGAQYGLFNYPVQVFPSDSMLNIYVVTNTLLPPTQLNNTYQQLNGTRVYFLEPNISYGSMCIDYQDTTGLTTNVIETWKFAYPNQTQIQVLNFVPGLALTTHCYTMKNVRGIQTWWGFNATRAV